jgi:hypothetical protein
MAALRQFKLPAKLPDQAYQAVADFFNTADYTIMVGTSEKNGQQFYHYEVLFINQDNFPSDVDADGYKTDVIIPHKFIGYETVEQFEARKAEETTI